MYSGGIGSYALITMLIAFLQVRSVRGKEWKEYKGVLGRRHSFTSFFDWVGPHPIILKIIFLACDVLLIPQ